ncbi:MAG: TonB-dependent receptor [Flavobacteriales bacterium]|nr:TonB-dependent receptor [Flavobacteriales bacterium]
MNKAAISIISAFALLTVGQTYGQEATQTDTINSVQTFVGNEQHIVKEANKMGSWPQIKTDVVEIPSITYKLIPNKLNVQIDPKLISPAKIKLEEPIKKLYRGYARAGFGLYTTPLAELYYMDGRNRNGSWSAHARHLSSTGGGVSYNDSIPDGFSQNEVHLWGKRFLKKHSMEAQINWDRQVMHYYGYNPELLADTSLHLPHLADAKQLFNNVDALVNLTSFYRDSTKINYFGELAFYNYRDRYDGMENNVNLFAHARKFVNTELYNADFHFNYNQFQYLDRETQLPTTYNNAILGVVPRIKTIREKLKVEVGAGIFVDLRGDHPLHFYPKAQASYSLFDDLFIPYIGIDGNLNRTTYKTVTMDNPFIVTDPELKSVSEKFTGYGGLRGVVTNNASFNIRAAYSLYDDFLYYVNDSTFSPGSQFVLQYDDLNVLNITGEITVNKTDRLKLLVRGDYYIYTTGVEAHPWNQPATRFTFSGTYNLQDKFNIVAEVYTVGKRKFKSLSPVQDVDPEQDGSYIVDLKGYADANLAVEYRYTKRLSAFVRFNNFLATKYQRWYGYRVQPFNAMLGATYSF